MILINCWQILDSSVGDISNIAPVARCAMAGATSNRSSSTSSITSNPAMLGKERLSRSISLSLSLKSPLETVPSSTEQSPIDDVVGAEAANLPPVRSITADLSPTTALARLTFDAMEADQQKTEVCHSFLLINK